MLFNSEKCDSQLTARPKIIAKLKRKFTIKAMSEYAHPLKSVKTLSTERQKRVKNRDGVVSYCAQGPISNDQDGTFAFSQMNVIFEAGKGFEALRFALGL
ncbi:MAG: hypothetical protein EOP04_16210 [Proteobacteria bacterium]|nr:MAG: hypothetical protein EOP04_16210 [Pseudomonadota bacterium]